MLVISQTRKTLTGFKTSSYLARVLANTQIEKNIVVDSKVFETREKAFQWSINKVGNAIYSNAVENALSFEIIIIAPNGEHQQFSINVMEETT